MTKNVTLPRIAITMGDPAGIGPEICARWLSDPLSASPCLPLIFGDAGVLDRVAEELGLRQPANVVSHEDFQAAPGDPDGATIIDLFALDARHLRPGVVDAATGRAAYKYIEAAIDAGRNRRVDAVVTCPIHKEAFRAAGVPYPGHTELFADQTGAKRTCMLLTSDEISCSFVTGHVGLSEVASLLSVERIVDVLELTNEAFSQLCKSRPKLVVCGLNPHAGEHGLFGNHEEERFITPAIAAARNAGIDVEGPLPADTAFLPDRRHKTDCYVCMYHDQGLVPLKALAFDRAVNVTLGLPLIRTSVDHGTAVDIAWQGRADLSSFREAIRLASQLSGHRQLSGIPIN